MNVVIPSLFKYFALFGFVAFTIYIIYISFWCRRLYKAIIKADPSFFGDNNGLFLAKYFARSSMLNVILSGQYRKLKDESITKKCDKCRNAVLIFFILFFLFVITTMIVQTMFGLEHV